MLDAMKDIEAWPVDHAAAAVVDPDGEVHHVGDPDRAFALASVTKLLTAMAVLVAAEEGSVDLDEPAEHPPGATLADLLCHASGLAPDRDEALAAPRRRRIYSNRGYELAAQRVAERAAMPFAEYLHEAVLAPLGMTGASLQGSPAHGGWATAADLVRFATDLRASRLVSTGSLEAMLSAQHPDLDGVLPGFGLQRPNPWGLGAEIRGAKHPHWTGSRNAATTAGHFGQSGTFLWWDPTARVSLVVLTDRAFGTWSVSSWPALSDAVLDEVSRAGGRAL